VCAEEVLGDPEFVEACTRELHFRTTASQFDYKNIISDYKARMQGVVTGIARDECPRA
jgi:hypothetical protein